MKVTITINREQVRLLRASGLIDVTDDAFALAYVIEQIIATTIPLLKIGMLHLPT